MAEAEADRLDGNRDKVPKYPAGAIGLCVRPLWLLAPLDLTGYRLARIACGPDLLSNVSAEP
jgi:hypothetical protein